MKDRIEIALEHDAMIHEAAASKKYRRAFFVTLLTTIVLAAGVAALWWRLHTSRSAKIEPSTAQTSDAAPPPMQSMSAEHAGTLSQPHTALAPIQRSPHRLQVIGSDAG